MVVLSRCSKRREQGNEPFWFGYKQQERRVRLFLVTLNSHICVKAFLWTSTKVESWILKLQGRKTGFCGKCLDLDAHVPILIFLSVVIYTLNH